MGPEVEYLSMSGPISDGEYLMSIIWIGHSIFPARTLLKQQDVQLILLELTWFSRNAREAVV